MEQSGRIGLCWTASTLSVCRIADLPPAVGHGLLDQTASPKCQYAIFNRAPGDPRRTWSTLSMNTNESIFLRMNC